MNWPEEYTFAAVDYHTNEAQDIGRLLIEEYGRRWVLLACRAASTGGAWVATWYGPEHAEAYRLPAGFELGPALVARLDAAERVDVDLSTGETEAA